ncbi:hypothetical protein Tco_1049263 [Tanacetum coccineum]
MVEENIHAPIRTDEQLVPVNARLPIGKSNLFMDLQKKQKNQIFRLSQFWKTLTMDTKSGINSFQLDELWFTLDAYLIRSALGITPKDSAHPFVAPPAGDLGVVTGTNTDYAKLILEEFVQAIKTFFYDAANLKVLTKKPKPYVIPYCRFTKLIICYLGGRHNIHKRPQSPLHITADDYSLSNLKFVPKGELDEIFRMAIPKDLITNVIQGGKKRKAPPAVEDDEYNLQRGIQMSLESFQAPVGGVAIREPDSGIIQKLLEIKGKGKGIATDEQVAQSLLDLQKPKTKEPQDDTSMNVVCDTLSPADADTGADTEKSNSEADTKILNVGEEQGEDDFNTVALEERIVKLDEGQAGSDPARPHREYTKLIRDSLSSMKNLNDAFTFGDQFLNDKPTEEEPGKANVETEVESMVTVPIHQASSSAPPLSTPIIDLTPPKLVSPPIQEPIFTANNRVGT